MAEFDPFREAPEDTHAEMMRATYEALRTHGYADLTVQRIGDEFPKSKSLIYKYYDGKDALLLDLLDFLLDQFRENVPGDEFDSPRAHLEALVPHTVPEAISADRQDFAGAMMDLRAQAVHDPEYRERFTETDRFMREHVAEIVEAGIEAGEFHPLDPTEVAAFIMTSIRGARHVRVSADEDAAVTGVREELPRYLAARLFVDP